MSQSLGINDAYLYQIVTGLRIPSPLLSRQINTKFPDFQLQDLRPNDWQDIWPELAVPNA